MTATLDSDVIELPARATAAAAPDPVVGEGQAVLSARHLAKHYGGRTVLRDVSLNLHLQC